MAEGWRRARDAARETRKPRNPWRVIPKGGEETDYGSEAKAYAAVRELALAGTDCTVRQWENGRWILHDEIDAAEWATAILAAGATTAESENDRP